MGEVRSCTGALPCLSLSGTALWPATSVCALAPPCPRGCATTTRRPRSRRRPRIGAGWDPVTKSISTINLPPCVCLRRETSSLLTTKLLFSLFVMGHEGDESYMFSPTLPNQASTPGTITLGLEGIEDDNGLCYCISVPDFSSKSRRPQLCCCLAGQRHMCRSSRTLHPAFTLAGSCHWYLTDAINFVLSSQPPALGKPTKRPFIS